MDEQAAALNDLDELARRHAIDRARHPAATGAVHDDDDDDRDKTVSWLLDVCLERCWSLASFELAVVLLDAFLVACNGIKKSQLQLSAVACMTLAAKMRDDADVSETVLVEYTDGAVAVKEVKAWEMLVLSKLNWTVNLVTAGDFVRPIFASAPSTGTNHAHEEDALLVLSLCACSAAMLRAHPAPARAIASVRMAAEHDDPAEEARLSSDILLRRLRVSAGQVASCQAQMETLLRGHLPHSSSSRGEDEDQAQAEVEADVESPPRPECAPISPDNQSPFKISSSSTPKSKPEQVRRREAARRRRILSEAQTSNPDEDDNKENDDSAIALNVTASSSASPPVSTSSKSSSNASSPDSGASSTTGAASAATTSEDVTQIERVLRLTSLAHADANVDPVNVNPLRRRKS